MIKTPNICVWYELDKNIPIKIDHSVLSSNKHFVDIILINNSRLIRVPSVFKENNYYFPFPVKTDKFIEFQVFMEINSKIKTIFINPTDLDFSAVINLYSPKESTFDRQKILGKIILNRLSLESCLLIEDIAYLPKLIKTGSKKCFVLVSV